MNPEQIPVPISPATEQQPLRAPVSTEEADEKFAALLYVCEDTRHWILQADTKASFLLTINGVVAGFMIPQALSVLSLWRKPQVSVWGLGLLSAILVLYVVWQLYAFWQTALVFVPRTPGADKGLNTRSRHVFNHSLSQHFPRLEDGDRLREEYHRLSAQELELEYLSQLQVDSMVCSAKYQAFRRAFRHLLFTLALAASGYLVLLLLSTR